MLKQLIQKRSLNLCIEKRKTPVCTELGSTSTRILDMNCLFLIENKLQFKYIYMLYYIIKTHIFHSVLTGGFYFFRPPKWRFLVSSRSIRLEVWSKAPERRWYGRPAWLRVWRRSDGPRIEFWATSPNTMVIGNGTMNNIILGMHSVKWTFMKLSPWIGLVLEIVIIDPTNRSNLWRLARR